MAPQRRERSSINRDVPADWNPQYANDRIQPLSYRRRPTSLPTRLIDAAPTQLVGHTNALREALSRHASLLPIAPQLATNVVRRPTTPQCAAVIHGMRKLDTRHMSKKQLSKALKKARAA